MGSVALFFLGIGVGSVPILVDSSEMPAFPFALASGHFLSLAVLLVAVGIVSVVGGIHAIRRSSRMWTLIGGVAAMISFFPFGVPATIFAVLMDREEGSAPSSGRT